MVARGTAGPPTDTTIDRQAEIVEAVIRHTGAPVHLVGHSFGALACLDVALCGLHPLMSLTLIEPVTFGLLRQQGEIALHEQFIAMREDYVRAFENGDSEAARRVVDYLCGQVVSMPFLHGCGNTSFRPRRHTSWIYVQPSIHRRRPSATFCFRPS